ncbi:unnamed protein product [Boreogadus saida]
MRISVDGVAGEQAAVVWALNRAVGSSYLECDLCGTLCGPLHCVTPCQHTAPSSVAPAPSQCQHTAPSVAPAPSQCQHTAPSVAPAPSQCQHTAPSVAPAPSQCNMPLMPYAKATLHLFIHVLAFPLALLPPLVFSQCVPFPPPPLVFSQCPASTTGPLGSKWS